MDGKTRELVRERAGNQCEYCLLRQEHSELSHRIEHIVAKQHGGTDEVDNLALACHRCNLCKGPNLTGLDPLSDDVFYYFIRGGIDGNSTFCTGTFALKEGPQPGGPLYCYSP